MDITFSKMQGLGNDFVVIDAVRQTIALNPEQIRHMAHRRYGIGCDQVLVVEPTKDHDSDFYYRIFNADGSEAEQCGNGARCLARFIRDQGLSDKQEVWVQTSARKMQLSLLEQNQVKVDMGTPLFDPQAIPFRADKKAKDYSLTVATQTISIGVVSLGNPHAVLQVPQVAQAPVTTLGPLIESHERFPMRTNVGFMQIISPSRIQLRVFERGVGETQACGSGACAAVAIGRSWGLLDDTVHCALTGGELVIQWQGGDNHLFMTGTAEHVFDGRIKI